MSNVKVKICGLRIMSDVRIVNEVHPAYAGFIFDPSRKRYIKPEDAHILIKFLDPQIQPVGVFVNPSMEMVLEYLAKCPLPIVQLHGQESNAFIEELRSQYFNVHQAGKQQAPLKILKAFTIRSKEDLDPALKSAADMVLLDHGIGGTGENFDWSLIQHFPRPFFLAGGLQPDNVAEAICMTRPFAVDVSSGVEGDDGHKSREKAIAFMKAVQDEAA